MSGILRRWMIFPLAGLLLLLGACEKEEPQAPATEQEKTVAEEQQQKPATSRETMQKADEGMQAEQGGMATAALEPTEGNQASGTVTFTAEDGGVRIVADIEGLEPGKHGIHIHEKGDCSAPDAKSAGGHFNPEGTPHGAPDDPTGQRHVGDLGNLEAGPDGTAHYERTDRVITLQGEHGIIGKAVIVHAGADDLETQPTGGAGPRVACGVIEEDAKETMPGTAEEDKEGGK